jgi:hypothetical protein
LAAADARQVTLSSQEFLRFLQLIAATHRRGNIHLAFDNYRTHLHPVQPWLAHHPRFHLHFTPTRRQLDESGGDLVLTPGAARNPSRRLPQHHVLRDAIQRFLDAWNEHAHPFAWTKTADQISANANHGELQLDAHRLTALVDAVPVLIVIARYVPPTYAGISIHSALAAWLELSRGHERRYARHTAGSATC